MTEVDNFISILVFYIVRKLVETLISLKSDLN